MKIQIDYYLNDRSMREAEHVSYYLEAEGFDVYLPHRDMPQKLRYLFSELMNEASRRDFVIVLWDSFSSEFHPFDLSYLAEAISRFRKIGLHKIVILNVTDSELPIELKGFREYAGLSGLADFLRSQRQPRRSFDGPTAAKFFLSYSSENLACAKNVAAHLSRHGSVWFAPENMIGRQDFMEELFDAVENCENFVQLITESSMTSPYCMRELALAVQFNKRVFPLSEVDINRLPKNTKFAIASRHVSRIDCKSIDKEQLDGIFSGYA